MKTFSTVSFKKKNYLFVETVNILSELTVFTIISVETCRAGTGIIVYFVLTGATIEAWVGTAFVYI